MKKLILVSTMSTLFFVSPDELFSGKFDLRASFATDYSRCQKYIDDLNFQRQRYFQAMERNDEEEAKEAIHLMKKREKRLKKCEKKALKLTALPKSIEIEYSFDLGGSQSAGGLDLTEGEKYLNRRFAGNSLADSDY